MRMFATWTFELIDDWAGKWWRFWSMRLNAIGLLILSWVQFDPVGALGVWNMMPSIVQDVLPHNFVMLIGGAFFALSMMARMVSQPRIQEKVDAAAEKIDAQQPE